MEQNYNKSYYEKNKEKMKEQIIKAKNASYPTKKRNEILNKINSNKYERLPYAKLEKYNIVYNKETKLYE